MQGEFAWKRHRVGEPVMEYATGEAVAEANVSAARTDDLAAHSRAATHPSGAPTGAEPHFGSDSLFRQSVRHLWTGRRQRIPWHNPAVHAKFAAFYRLPTCTKGFSGT